MLLALRIYHLLTSSDGHTRPGLTLDVNLLHAACTQKLVDINGAKSTAEGAVDLTIRDALRIGPVAVNIKMELRLVRHFHRAHSFQRIAAKMAIINQFNVKAGSIPRLRDRRRIDGEDLRCRITSEMHGDLLRDIHR